MPAALDAWVDAGAELLSGSIGDREVAMGVWSRRSSFEVALRRVAARQEGLRLHRAHVDSVALERGRAVGIKVEGAQIDADLVIDASGRSGRTTRALRPTPDLGGPCGIAYVDRQYQLRPGAEMGPLINPIAFQATYDGYLVLVFPHEHRIFSVVIIRSTADRALAQLRHGPAFDAAAAAIPALAEWTDPDRAVPITPVLPGGPLLNVYRRQVTSTGELVAPGLVFLGDAVCTTTPNFGRGMATTMMQCRELIRLLDEGSGDVAQGDVAQGDLAEVGRQFDDWCEQNMRPWVEDHVQMDDALRRRWDGADVDLSQPLPSDLIMEAAQVDPSIGAVIGPYLAMMAGPSSLRVAEPAARAVYESGWRPPTPAGPSRVELVEVVQAALAR